MTARLAAVHPALIPAQGQFAVLMILLVLSAVVYAVALCVILMRRTLPDQIAPDRMVLVGLGLAAGKTVLGPYIPAITPSLAGLCILACGYAIMRTMKTVIESRRLPLLERTEIDRWAAILIPPIAGIALLSLYDTVPDRDFGRIIDAFIVVNIIPALYLLIQIPVGLLSRSR